DWSSDVCSSDSHADKDGDDYVINGSKTWITNARKSDLIALLCKTEPEAEPRHKGISIILVEKGEGFTVSQDLSKLGYKGVETCELNFENLRQPQSQLLGEVEGVGFKQMMKIGRAHV